jgi:hypothetical protein
MAFLGGLFSSYLREIKPKTTKPPVTKVWIGVVGSRTTFNGSLQSCKYLPGGAWGDSWLYKFQDDVGNDVVWFSTKDQNIEVGQKFAITGSIKRHDINKYTNQPQTIILRAKLQKI